MKVLFIASDNNPASGAFLSMVKLNVILRNTFHIETKVIVPREGEGQKLLEENGIPFELVKSFDWVVDLSKLSNTSRMIGRDIRNRIVNHSAVNQIAKIIRNESFDLVHINTTYAYIGALAAKNAHVPFIWHLREMLEEDQGRCIYRKETGYKLIAEANRVVAISSCVYDKYNEIMPDAKLVKIFNGIDTVRFYAPNKTIMKKKPVTLIYGGGYSAKKGIYELSSALSYLKTNGFNNFKVLYIGEANEKYKDSLHKSGLDANVRYLGYQKDVEKWYRMADIAFSCSAMEAFGRKTVEAMLCGCLMIAADTGGSLDIVQHQKTGLMYKQGDPLSLAYTILYAMNHPKESQRIANEGRQFALQNFDAEENARQIFEMYNEVLGEVNK